jgi:ketol-acid reductoisomerase
MRRLLSDIRDGSFAEEWIEENRAGRPNFLKLREEGKQHPIEQVGRELREMMPFVSFGRERVEDVSGG